MASVVASRTNREIPSLNDSAGMERTPQAESQEFNAQMGDAIARVRVTRGPDNHGVASILRNLGVKFLAFSLPAAGALATTREADAAVIPFNVPESTFVSNGEAASAAGRFGAIEGVHASGASFHTSMTFITDLSGNPLTIQQAPANGTYLDLGGFGMRSAPGGTFKPLDGLPGLGQAIKVGVSNPLVDKNKYISLELRNAATDTAAGNFDSGGFIGDSSGPTAIMSGVNGNTQGSVTWGLQLYPLKPWIEQVESHYPAGTLFGIVAGHAAYDPIDPVTFTDVSLVDYNHPYMGFSVLGFEVNSDWNASWGTFDGQRTDAAVVAFTTSAPEPSSVSLLALGAAGLLSRRRRRHT